MKSEKDFLIAFVQKTLGIEPEQVPTLLYKKGADGQPTTEIDENAINTFLEKDKARVTLIKSQVNTDEYFNNGYKKAQSEVLSAKEKALRDKYGVTDESLKLDDLVNHVVTLKVKEASTGDIEEAKVKSHPLFIQTLNKVSEVENAWKTKYEDEVNKFNGQLTQIELKTEAKGLVAQALSKYDPVLSPNKDRAAWQQEDFYNRTLSRPLKKVENVGIVVLNDKGEVMTDAQSNVLTIDKYAETLALTAFDKKKQSEKGNAGNGGEGGSGGQGSGGQGGNGYSMPTTADEYKKLMFNTKISATDKAKIKEHWNKQQRGE